MIKFTDIFGNYNPPEWMQAIFNSLILLIIIVIVFSIAIYFLKKKK